VAADDVDAAAWVSQADIRAGSLEMSARVAEMLDLAVQSAQGSGHMP